MMVIFQNRKGFMWIWNAAITGATGQKSINYFYIDIATAI